MDPIELSQTNSDFAPVLLNLLESGITCPPPPEIDSYSLRGSSLMGFVICPRCHRVVFMGEHRMGLGVFTMTVLVSGSVILSSYRLFQWFLPLLLSLSRRLAPHRRALRKMYYSSAPAAYVMPPPTVMMPPVYTTPAVYSPPGVVYSSPMMAPAAVIPVPVPVHRHHRHRYRHMFPPMVYY